MRKQLNAAIAIALLTGCSGQAAEAPEPAPSCGPRKLIADTLASDFGERPATAVTLPDDSVLEIWTSLRGSWTVLAVNPEGRACIIGGGEPVKARRA